MCVQNLNEREDEIFPQFSNLTNLPIPPPQKKGPFVRHKRAPGLGRGRRPALLAGRGHGGGGGAVLHAQHQARISQKIHFYISTFYISGKVAYFKATFPYVFRGQIAQNLLNYTDVKM